MDIWNIKDLGPPPVLCCKVTMKEIDIRLLDVIVKNGIDFFENQQHLCTEAALLSRTMYRLKMKFRNSKDFKSLERLCRVLRTYLQIQVSQLLKRLSQSIPQNYKATKTSVLTKNLMDYVLVRIQGLGKTLCRILETCKIVCSLMQQRVRLGHFWKVAVVVLASSSRIFVITKSILKYVCEMYSNLLPFSSSLNNAGVRFLPEGYTFPARLDEWLNIDWLDMENVIEIEDDESAFSYFKITDSDDDVEFCDEYILVNDENDGNEEDKDEIDVESDEQNEVSKVDLLNKTSDIDVGEVIDVSDVINDSEIIEINDEPRRKMKRKKTVKKKSDDGEVINVSDGKIDDDVIDITDEPRNRRKKKNSFVGQMKTGIKRKRQREANASCVGTGLKNRNVQSPNKKRKLRHQQNTPKRGKKAKGKKLLF